MEKCASLFLLLTLPPPPPPHSQLSQERSEYCAATDRLQGSLQRVMTELDSTLTELEGTRTNNMLLKQQVRERVSGSVWGGSSRFERALWFQ